MSTADPTQPEGALPEPWDALSYDPDSGTFTWNVNRGSVKAGSKAGSRLGSYWSIHLGKKTYLAHRVAVFLMTGSFPPRGMPVDHIDGDGVNNRWSNLRVVTIQVNNQNLRRAVRGSKSGLIGAHWHTNGNVWTSSIRHNGRSIALGTFSSAEAANMAYLEVKRKLHAGCTI